MRVFRPKEGDEGERKKVQPKITEPEKPTIEAKDKLNASEREGEKKKSWELTPEQQRKVDEGNKEISERYKNKLDRPGNSSSEGDPSKGQRQLERGHEVERE